MNIVHADGNHMVGERRPLGNAGIDTYMTWKVLGEVWIEQSVSEKNKTFPSVL